MLKSCAKDQKCTKKRNETRMLVLKALHVDGEEREIIPLGSDSSI